MRCGSGANFTRECTILPETYETGCCYRFCGRTLIFFQTRLRRRSKSESSGTPIKIYIVQAHSQAADRLERRPVLEERGIDPGLAADDEGVGGFDLFSQRLGV